MKIRTCFVSNSSSSSFCIMGIHINLEDLLENDRLNKEILEYGNKEFNTDFKSTEEMGISGYLWEVLEEWVISTSVNTGILYSTEDEGGYIGLQVEELKLEETLEEFEQRSKDLIKKVLDINNADVEWYYGEMRY